VRCPSQTQVPHNGAADGSTAEQLKSYDILQLPPQQSWVILKPDLFFQQWINEDENNAGKEGEGAKTNKKIVAFRFKSTAHNGDVIIKNFIDEAFAWFVCFLFARCSVLCYLVRYIRKIESTQVCPIIVRSKLCSAYR
jgi:hypothetical protein